MKAITRCVGWHLDRRGWPTWNAESSHLALDREVTALDSLLSHSITYRIALGPRAAQKAFTLRSLPGTPLPEPSKPFLTSADGFSLHAGGAGKTQGSGPADAGGAAPGDELGAAAEAGVRH